MDLRIYSSFIACLMLMLGGTVSAQHATNQNKVWVFGTNTGVDFNTGLPVTITTTINTSEGSASVADGTTGALLFYTDGRSVRNSIHGVMPSGASIVAYGTASSSQGALIVPFVGDPNKYYVFSLGDNGGGARWANFSYSVVDMTLAGGLGDVVVSSRGTLIRDYMSEKLIAIPGNSCNIWVIAHNRDSTLFYAYEINATGLNLTPVVSNVGTRALSAGLGGYGIGVMKGSPDRTKIATATYNPGSSTRSKGVELYDFDPTTGVVSNCRLIDSLRDAYGLEFSPNSRLLYSSEGTTADICQYDVTLATGALIRGSRYTVSTGSGYPQLKLAPDNKIYMVGISGTNFLDCINNPDIPGAGCSFAAHVVNLAPGRATFGLPNIVYTVVGGGDTLTMRHDTVVCFQPGDSVQVYAHDTGSSFVWNDGRTGRARWVTAPGKYWVSISQGCDVTVDTNYVVRLPLDPKPVISGVDTYCHTSPFVPFLVAGSNIKWYPDSVTMIGTTTAPVINTNVPGTYVVYATQAIACISPKASFTVTVLPAIVPDFNFSYRRGCIEDTIDFVNIPTAADHYLWSFGNGLGSDTSHNFTNSRYAVHKTYTVTLKAYTSLCAKETSKVIDARHPIKADFNASPDTLCAVTESTTLTSASVVTFPAVNSLVDYTWKFGDGNVASGSGSVSPDHTYTVGGQYPATLVITDNIGCKDSITKYIYALQLKINTFHDTTLCVSQPFQLKNTVRLTPLIQIPDYTYDWTPATNLDNPAVQNPYFFGLGDFTYNFTTSLTRFGCPVTETIRINSVMGKKLANVTANQTINYGGSAILQADSLVYYMWLPNDGSLDNPNINNPVASPTQTTKYTVYGYDGNGCMDSAYVTVKVDDKMQECMPSAFTPNGDGRNDVFRPFCMEFQKSVDFRVFNRWGEQVFYSNNARTGWDGTYKGVAQDLGVYYYMLVVARPGGDGQNIEYKGEVTLIR